MQLTSVLNGRGEHYIPCPKVTDGCQLVHQTLERWKLIFLEAFLQEDHIDREKLIGQLTHEAEVVTVKVVIIAVHEFFWISRKIQQTRI